MGDLGIFVGQMEGRAEPHLTPGLSLPASDQEQLNTMKLFIYLILNYLLTEKYFALFIRAETVTSTHQAAKT